MALRNVMTALSCRSCQASLFETVLTAGRLGMATHVTRLPSKPSTLQQFQQRNLSVTRRLQLEALKQETPTDERRVIEEGQLNDTNAETPWFLDVEPPQQLSSQLQQTRPVSPEGAPPPLDPLLQYVFEDMGLDDMALFDLRELSPRASLGPNLFMVFGTARSERHLHISAGRLVRWLRKNHGIKARGDGLIGAGELRTKLRRIRKKAKLMGTNANVVPSGDNGISTGWVCVNFSTTNVDEEFEAAATSFDASGRVSGFDAPADSSTVVVQCMTEARRKELGLEILWRNLLRRSIRENRDIENEAPYSAEELDRQVKARMQMPTGDHYLNASTATEAATLDPAPGTPVTQWDIMAASRRRYFSTSARRQATPSDASASPDLDAVAAQVRDVQARSIPLEVNHVVHFIGKIFEAGPPDAETTPARLALTDQLLLAASEHGISVQSHDVLVALIESIATSPAYGPALERAQTNLEMLLLPPPLVSDPAATANDPAVAPSPDHIRRLMMAYAKRRDWPRFWDAMRTPARFRQPRGPELYELAYATAAKTGDAEFCAEALRWLYFAMRRERPSVLPCGAVYDALRACILVADPAAEGLLHNPPPKTDDVVKMRRYEFREFRVMLADIHRVLARLKDEEAKMYASRASAAEYKQV